MPPNVKIPPLSKEDQERLAQSGIDLAMKNRCGSYLQMDQDIVHAECEQEGIEVLSYKKAMENTTGSRVTTGRSSLRKKTRSRDMLQHKKSQKDT